MFSKKATTLLKSTKWHYLGFAFFWAASFAGLTQHADHASSDSYLLYSSCQILFSIIAVLCLVPVAKRYSPLPRRLSLASGLLLSLGSALFYLASKTDIHLISIFVISGILVGLASGSFYVLWQQFFASEGSFLATVYIPLSAALSVILSFALWFSPLAIRIACTVVVLPILSTVSLWKSLGFVEIDEPYNPLNRTCVRKTIKAFWRPVYCVSALGFIWKLLAQIAEARSADSLIALLGGLTLAIVVVLAIELFSKRGFEILRIYQVLFPFVTGVFLFPVFLGVNYVFISSSAVLFGFEIVNLLLLIACANYASDNHYSPTHIYALLITPSLASMGCGNLLGAYLSPLIAYDFSVAIVILFLCIYLLSFGLFLSSLARKRRGIYVDSESGKETSHQQGSFNDVHLYLIDPFSKRENEVVELLLRGNSVAAVSKKLFISENTTRGHMKNIYRKANVHSRQELIDLYEERLNDS